MKYDDDDWKEFCKNAEKYLNDNTQYATARAIHEAMHKQITLEPLNVSEGVEVCTNCLSILKPYGYYCCMCGQKVRSEYE